MGGVCGLDIVHLFSITGYDALSIERVAILNTTTASNGEFVSDGVGSLTAYDLVLHQRPCSMRHRAYGDCPEPLTCQGFVLGKINHHFSPQASSTRPSSWPRDPES